MTARRPSFWWLLAIPAACLFILGMSDPVLFIWAFVGLLIGYAIAASWMWGVWHDMAVNAEGRAMFAEDEVAHLKRLYGDATPVPLLRVVPAQRDGSEHEWPRIARAIGIDEIGDKA